MAQQSVVNVGPCYQELDIGCFEPHVYALALV